MTKCQLCDGDTNELLLLGSSANSVCQTALGEAYSGLSTQRIANGLCDRCKTAFKGGAAAYFCNEGAQQGLLMFSAEAVTRLGCPGSGKINRVRPEDWTRMLGMVKASREAEVPA